MKFGTVDINPNGWNKWTFEQFKEFYDQSLKGKVTETPEEIAKVLGVPIPVKKKTEKSE
jgi:hypothetical protein